MFVYGTERLVTWDDQKGGDTDDEKREKIHNKKEQEFTQDDVLRQEKQKRDMKRDFVDSFKSTVNIQRSHIQG